MSVQSMAWVIDHSKQSGSDLLCLLMIANHAHADGTNSYCGIKTIAKECRMSPRQITRIIRNLEASGEIVVERRSGGSHIITVKMTPDNLSSVSEECHVTPDIAVSSTPDIAVSSKPSLTVNESKPEARGASVAPQSIAAQEFFRQFHRKRWPTPAMRELFEQTEIEVGPDRMMSAVLWAAHNNIPRVPSICTAARNGKQVRKNGGGDPFARDRDRGTRGSTMRDALAQIRSIGVRLASDGDG